MFFARQPAEITPPDWPCKCEGCPCPPEGQNINFQVVSFDTFFSFSDVATWNTDHWEFSLNDDDSIITFFLACGPGHGGYFATFVFIDKHDPEGVNYKNYQWESGGPSFITTCRDDLVVIMDDGETGFDPGSLLLAWA